MNQGFAKLGWMAMGLTLMVAGCGRDDTQQQFGFTSSPSFFVNDVSPGFNETDVDLNTPIQLVFNQNVDVNSASGSVQLIEQTGSSGVDITSQLQVTVSGNIMTLVSSTPFKRPASYKLTLTPTLKSATGSNLRATSVFPFFTGPNPGILAGVNIDYDNEPSVVNFQYQRSCYCRAMVFNTNEALLVAPQVEGKIRVPTGIYWTGNMIAMATNETLSQWMVDFGCNGDFEDGGMEFEILLPAGSLVDFEGNSSTESFNKHKENGWILNC